MKWMTIYKSIAQRYVWDWDKWNLMC